VTNGGSENPCHLDPQNSNQALILKWAVSGMKNPAYFEYSAIR